ncbi:hypothetical protein M0802_013987 [Mischocyttarus mexicanus]|nr:hypothetical protein M0802_013987 [Mischocyttarus mexicanus]
MNLRKRPLAAFYLIRLACVAFSEDEVEEEEEGGGGGGGGEEERDGKKVFQRMMVASSRPTLANSTFRFPESTLASRKQLEDSHGLVAISDK